MKKIYQVLSAFIVVGAIVIISQLEFQNSHSSEKIFSHQLELKNKYGNLPYSEIVKLPKQDRPDLAALQHFEMTKDPSLGYPPQERKVLAFEKLMQNKKIAKSAISNVQWNERGPNNVGGRTRALMFDPNDATNKKVWAGGISGGLWVNEDITDANSGWTNIDDFMASLSIATLVYDPNSTTTFYLGTGERVTRDFAGLGIWKSTDGGDSWSRLTNTSDFSYVSKMVITASSTIIAATENGIKRSTDGGDTWTSPATADDDMADVELASNGDLFAGDFSGNVLKSTDDGLTWTSTSPASGGQRVEIGLSEASSGVIYALSASGGNVSWFSKSTDGGVNWSDLPIPMYSNQNCTESTSDFTRGQAWYDLIIGVHPTDEDIVIIGGIDLHRSTDGGTNWELISYWTGSCDDYVHADQHAIQFRPGSPNEAIFGCDGGVFYSADVGDASNPEFDDRNKNYNVTQFYAAAGANEALATEFLAGSQDNGTQRFLTAGVNATEEATGGDGAFCHIDQDDANFQITSYVYSNYYLSTNHGSSFSTLNDDAGNTGKFINPTEYDSDANILYGAAGSNQIERISGISGTPSPMEMVSVDLEGWSITTIKASPHTANRIFVGVDASGGGLIFMLDNADATPTVTKIAASFNETRGNWTSSLDVGASDNQLIATFSNYGVHSVFETLDGGSNWSSKEGNLDDIPVYGGIYNPDNRNEVLIATELGVWSTDDFNASSPEWGSSNTGLANVSTRMIKMRSSDNLILVATHGRGLFTSTSFGPDFIAGIAYDKSITYVGEPINFINNSSGSINNVLWNFGDGFTSTDNNPSHVYPAPGEYTVRLEVNNGQSFDEKEILILPNRSIPYLAADGGDFESNTEDFYADNESGTPFERGNSAVTGKDGTTSGDNAWVTGMMENQYQDDSRAYLYTPGYDFSEAGTYTISFDVKYSFEAQWDGFIVEYTLDAGESWIKLGNSIEASWYNQLTVENAIWGDIVPIFTGTTTGFETKSKDVSSLAGNGSVGFRINFGTDANTVDVGMAIDDFELDGPSTLPVPDFLSTNPEICEDQTVTFNDNSTGTISNYSWSFGVGALPETATGYGPHEVSYATGGMYTTILTVTGTGGDVVETKTDYVSVNASSIIDNTLEVNYSTFSACNEAEALITVKNSNLGVKYQAFDDANNMPIGGYTIGDGNDIILNLGVPTETYSVYIKAIENNSCESILSSTLDFTSTGPLAKSVTSDYTEAICFGQTVTFTIEDSENGILYSIIDLDGGSEISSETGDGNTIEIETTLLESNISIKVEAENEAENCSIIILENLDIEVNPLPDATITQDGAVMEVPAGESSYQWYYDNEAIAGATKNSYNPAKLGDYTCEVTTTLGCTSTSEVFTTLVTGNLDNYFGNSIFLYPNPTSDKVYLDISNEYKGKVALKIYNINGKLFFNAEENKNNVTFIKEVNVSDYNRGIYFVELQFGDKKEIRKILIK